MGFLTPVVDVRTVLSGVLFQHHVATYYLTLVGIFLAGLTEVWTAFWVSQTHDRRTFGKAVLWASVVPLVVVIGLGGYAVLFNMG